VLGIPHPPGNPLFVIMAHAWGLLPLTADYAARINLFAAFTGAAAAGLWFLVAERWMREVVPVRWARLAAAFAGVLVSATSWTVWNQSTVNEKVYTVSVLSIALVTWLAVHWGDDEPGPHRDRWVILIAYIIALSSTNHMMGVLAAPAVAIYILWTDWQVVTRPWVIGGVVLAVLIGISINYLFLPIRAAQFPPINEGEPVGFFSQALRDVLNRVQYAKPSVMDRQADLSSQFGNYWQYFSWQFARDWGQFRGFFAGCSPHSGWWGSGNCSGRTAGRARGRRDAGHPDGCAHLLLELQVWVLDAPGAGPPARGPRARLLLHRLIRLLRRAGVRRARRDDARPRQPARGTPGRAAPLARGGAGASDRRHSAAGQPDDGEPRG
jgi:hypothetical protein